MVATSPNSPASPARADPPAASSPPAGSGPASPKQPSSPTQRSSPPAASAVPENTGFIEPDADAQPEYQGDDASSGYGSGDNQSDSTSVMSSIFKYRVANGRTYHSYRANEADYFLPNDDRENDRLDFQHNITIRVQDNQLYLCPAGKDKPMKRVLDIGTGTGIWAVEVGDEHPETAIVGVDLSPIQPIFVAPNVEFFVDDLEQEWTFVNPFDFIYVRYMTGSIRDWPKLLRQAYQHLNPGGWIELCDPTNPLVSDDGTLPEDCALMRWNRLWLEASVKLGSPFDSSSRYKQQLIDAGYENVVQVDYKWPINTWPKDAKYKDIGAWTCENITSGLQAMSLMLFTNLLGWSATEVEVLLVDVRKDMRNRNYHAYWPVHVVYGQKPDSE